MPDLDFRVSQHGTDSSGRPLLFTNAFWTVWLAILAHPRVRPFAANIVWVQGAFMSRVPGGGATASAGYHDLAGCGDVRTWNLTTEQERALWWVSCLVGAIYFWKRDLSAAHGGMDEHGHGLAVWDQPLASGAQVQRGQALGGRDGLASNGPDYHPRPDPRPTLPDPAIWKEPDIMADPDVVRTVNDTHANTELILERISGFRQAEAERDRAAAKKAREVAQRQIAALGGVVDRLTELATEKDADKLQAAMRDLARTVKTHLADDPDVDGPDNPAPEKVDQ